MVSYGVRLSVEWLSEIRKPQVERLGRQRNPLDFKAEQGSQRQVEYLPSTKNFTVPND